MPRYAPLPLVSIDPRNEAQLVQDASQRVYEASNGTLNDFSSGNPLAVLLEGQAFAQGEFLFWANQLPEKILIEWIGPFLGSMRRLGTPSAALVTITVPPQNTDIVIPAGSGFTTDTQLTAGQSILFITPNNYTIPAGRTQISVPVYSKFVGAEFNAPANSITTPPPLGVTGIVVTNPQPAVGGSDVEGDEEVKERFFTLIRRRNPVSQSDWENFFIDLFGVGTETSVLPNRSSPFSYKYNSDYEKPNGQVSFFVLGPNGVELTDDQLRRGQNIINFSVPIENKGYIYPVSLSQAQYNLTLEVDANGTYGPEFQSSSLDFRNRAYSVFIPGNVFPFSSTQTVGDIDAAFYNTFDPSVRFKDPKVLSSAIYNTPNLLSKEVATYTEIKTFDTSGSLLKEGDLVSFKGATTLYYPVEEPFTPYSTDKFDQTVYGNLQLKQIKALEVGLFNTGDVVTRGGKLYVICESLEINFDADIERAFANGKISPEKNYSLWQSGEQYVYSVDSVVNPDLVEYDYSESEFKPLTKAGQLVWLVSKNFTLELSTNNVTGAQAEFKLGAALNSGVTNLRVLEKGQAYLEGEWVYTPAIGSGPNFEVDPFYHYVDTSLGGLVKLAQVLNSFTFDLESQTVTEYFNSLVDNGVIREVSVYDGTNGLPTYKYKPRFKCGQYVEFRDTSGGSPTYLIAAKYFTPCSTNLEDLKAKGLVIDLAPSPSQYSQLTDLINQGKEGRIKGTSLLEEGSGLVDGTYSKVPLEYAEGYGRGNGASANLIVEDNQVKYFEVYTPGVGYDVGDVLVIPQSLIGGTGVEVTFRVESVFDFKQELKPFARMFTFFQGDRTFFRDGSRVQSYTATSSVTPLFDFSVYYRNGTFIESENYGASAFDNEVYIPFYRPDYANFAENTVIDQSGKNYYRVMTAFTPEPNVSSWTQLDAPNSPRNEEYAGNLLRYVSMYTCEEPILPQFDLLTSSMKLGVAQITIVPKNTGRLFGLNQKLSFVWENSDSATSAELSWFPGTSFPYPPVNYMEGTLQL
jgi:hypothetical protein